ncbi:MAG: transketolase [Gluconacetobacter diazotrophicus]|nr:transketolase [Gluconacetobacter diazotrophicus]
MDDTALHPPATAHGGGNAAWTRDCQAIADGIRRRVLGHTVTHGGYLSQACSSAEILGLLYGAAMRLGPSEGPLVPPAFGGAPSVRNPRHVSGMLYNGRRAPELDRFFLSPTHYALTLYAALIETGRLGKGGLDQFNKDGSTVEMIGGEHSPGHETNGGSFGQTISQAAGVAWARRFRGETGRVWVFLSDGECQEGQIWEAVMNMAFQKLDTVTVVVDVNGQQVDGRTDEVMGIEPLVDKFAAFGAVAVKVDGHDLRAMRDALDTPHRGRPLVLAAYTSPFQGIELLRERYPNLHYVRFRNEEERERYRDLYRDMMAEAVR